MLRSSEQAELRDSDIKWKKSNTWAINQGQNCSFKWSRDWSSVI